MAEVAYWAVVDHEGHYVRFTTESSGVAPLLTQISTGRYGEAALVAYDEHGTTIERLWPSGQSLGDQPAVADSSASAPGISR